MSPTPPGPRAPQTDPSLLRHIPLLAAPPSCKSGSLEALSALPDGLVAEWLRRGLQILVRGFDSLRGLQKPAKSRNYESCETALLGCEGAGSGMFMTDDSPSVRPRKCGFYSCLHKAAQRHDSRRRFRREAIQEAGTPRPRSAGSVKEINASEPERPGCGLYSRAPFRPGWGHLVTLALRAQPPDGACFFPGSFDAPERVARASTCAASGPPALSLSVLGPRVAGAETMPSLA